MRRNVEARLEAVAERPEVERVDFEYNDGEIVLDALCSEVDEGFEDFVAEHNLEIESGPQWVGVGLEVILA